MQKNCVYTLLRIQWNTHFSKKHFFSLVLTLYISEVNCRLNHGVTFQIWKIYLRHERKKQKKNKTKIWRIEKRKSFISWKKTFIGHWQKWSIPKSYDYLIMTSTFMNHKKKTEFTLQMLKLTSASSQLNLK